MVRHLAPILTAVLAAVVPAAGLAQARGGIEGRVIDPAADTRLGAGVRF